MKTIFHKLVVWSAALTVVANLHAAITDADLAKVTQLIQEGKTTRAKLEIGILLDDNPNDANAPKLRKILDSLGNQNAGNAAKSSGQNYEASEKETIEWLAKNVSVFWYDFWSDSSSFGGIDKFLETNNSKLTLTLIAKTHPDGALISMQEVEIDLSTLQKASLGSAECSLILTSGKPDIHTREWKFQADRTGDNYRVFLNDVLINSPPLPSSAMLARRNFTREEIKELKKFPTKQTTATRIELTIKSDYKDYAPRMKKAFDHLIQLSGGGKAEAF